jgi:hypothetical protein
VGVEIALQGQNSDGHGGGLIANLWQVCAPFLLPFDFNGWRRKGLRGGMQILLLWMTHGVLLSFAAGIFGAYGDDPVNAFGPASH